MASGSLRASLRPSVPRVSLSRTRDDPVEPRRHSVRGFLRRVSGRGDLLDGETRTPRRFSVRRLSRRSNADGQLGTSGGRDENGARRFSLRRLSHRRSNNPGEVQRFSLRGNQCAGDSTAIQPRRFSLRRLVSSDARHERKRNVRLLNNSAHNKFASPLSESMMNDSQLRNLQLVSVDLNAREHLNRSTRFRRKVSRFGKVSGTAEPPHIQGNDLADQLVKQLSDVAPRMLTHYRQFLARCSDAHESLRTMTALMNEVSPTFIDADKVTRMEDVLQRWDNAFGSSSTEEIFASTNALPLMGLQKSVGELTNYDYLLEQRNTVFTEWVHYKAKLEDLASKRDAGRWGTRKQNRMQRNEEKFGALSQRLDQLNMTARQHVVSISDASMREVKHHIEEIVRHELLRYKRSA